MSSDPHPTATSDRGTATSDGGTASEDKYHSAHDPPPEQGKPLRRVCVDCCEVFERWQERNCPYCRGWLENIAGAT